MGLGMKLGAGLGERGWAGLRRLVTEVGLFSRHVIGVPLRPYQLEPATAIMASVLERRGLSVSVMMARQAGKNQTSAHVECCLLNLCQRQGGNLVKCAPTFLPQALTSKLRLEAALNNPWHAGRWRSRWSRATALGAAQVLFFSADERANVVGATAHHLLEFDEAQAIAREKHDRDFAPMASTTNATRVYWGTAWDGRTLLEEVAAHHQELERRDGLRRHFRVPWEVVAEHNPLYRAYVEAERDRLGEDHPLFRTQYRLLPLAAGDRFLSAAQRAALRGDHARRREPADEQYVAGVDVAGAAEASAGQDAALRALAPRRDSTVVTIAAVSPVELAGGVRAPRLRVVEHVWWTGRSQPEQLAGLVALLGETWRVRRVAIDATGVGAGLAGFLRAALGAAVVEPFVFTAPSKSRLAYELLAAINGGRLAVYAPDGSPECAQFWRECELARQAARPNGTLDFQVPEREGHDDFLMSLALTVRAAGELVPEAVGALVPAGPEFEDGPY